MGRELNGFEAFCAGFRFSAQGFNGETASDEGIDVSNMPELQDEWDKLSCPKMESETRAGLVHKLATYISEVSDAQALNSAWAKLYTADGELLGEISPRHLLVALLEEMRMIDLHTEDGSKPVDISDTERLEFYIG